MTGRGSTWEIYIRSTPEKLWEALTQPEQTRRWFYRTLVHSDWQPGSSVVYRDQGGRHVIEGQVLTVEVGERLITSFSLAFPPQVRDDLPSRLSWEIKRMDEVCKLTITHDGFGDETATSRSVDSVMAVAAGNLKALLERGRILPVQTIVVDCAHPGRLATFWARVLSYVEQGTDDGNAAVVDSSGIGPRLKFNVVPERKTVKNRIHMDIAVENVDVEVERIIRLGGRKIRDLGGPVVMADPEGNEFCIF